MDMPHCPWLCACMVSLSHTLPAGTSRHCYKYYECDVFRKAGGTCGVQLILTCAIKMSRISSYTAATAFLKLEIWIKFSWGRKDNINQRT